MIDVVEKKMNVIFHFLHKKLIPILSDNILFFFSRKPKINFI